MAARREKLFEKPYFITAKVLLFFWLMWLLPFDINCFAKLVTVFSFQSCPHSLLLAGNSLLGFHDPADWSMSAIFVAIPIPGYSKNNRKKYGMNGSICLFSCRDMRRLSGDMEMTNDLASVCGVMVIEVAKPRGIGESQKSPYPSSRCVNFRPIG
uniref:Uncharacterized protein n=1 Tax=Tanacetum cinerariifolium TaxID=118510 RepID=A0A6L2L5Z9_TANCI|nr:hypothetical protein [Tanacetum cinerariifolium]